MPNALKLALVTDIHHGVDSTTKQGSQALTHLATFAGFCADYSPHLVVEMGDRLNDVDRETDRRRLEELTGAFAALPVPHRHLLGNHDVNRMTAADNAELLGHPMSSASLVLQGWRLVFWQADTRLRNPQHVFEYLPADLDWLRTELAASAEPCIVFSHVPLDGASMRGNYYFQETPHAATYQQLSRVQAVLAESGKVAACVAGHVHWNTHSTFDGIPCFTLQSLTERFTQPQGATGTWGTLELDAEEIRFQAHGADRVAYTVPRRDPAARWMPPVAPYHLRRPTQAPPADLTQVRGLILDMDGVLYRGEKALPGAADFVRWWKQRGGRAVTLTNNARKTPEAYEAKLRGLGIAIPAADVLTAAHATADWLLGLAAPPKALVLGSAALRGILAQAGVRVLEAAAVDSGEQPDVVVAGYDPALRLAELDRAVACLHRGAQLVASNPDRQVPAAGTPEPETGSVIAYLEAATGRTATVLGKPHKAPYALALQRLGLPAEAVLAVGDTLYTDVAGAVGAGIAVALVHTPAPAPGAPGPHPTLAVPDLAALQAALSGA